MIVDHQRNEIEAKNGRDWSVQNPIRWLNRNISMMTLRGWKR